MVVGLVLFMVNKKSVKAGSKRVVLSKKGVPVRVNGRKSVSGEHSVIVQDFKAKSGLVTMAEVRRLPVDSFDLLRRKIRLMDEYAVANQKIVDLVGSVGGRVSNSLNLFVDLQARLLVFEESFLERKKLARSRIVDIDEELLSCGSDVGVARLSKEKFGLEQFLLSDVMENKTWQEMRKQMSSEMQFIHKHGVDAADVQSRIEGRKRARDDDDLWTVEVEE